MEEVVNELKKYNINDVSIFKPSYKREITDYLFKNSIRFSLLIIFGGDGTFNEVINGLMLRDEKPKILYVPTGTVNDLGKYLSLPKQYTKSFEFLNDSPIAIDICKVNEKYFSYVLACGKFTNVSYGNNSNKFKKIFGRFYYYFKGVKDLFKNTSINLSINNEKSKKYSLILFLNIWRVGNFKIRCRRRNKLNDGSINVVLFKNTIFFGLISIFLFLIFGIVIKGQVLILNGNQFNIEIDEKKQFNTDGEESYNTKCINVSVIKEALKIYIPKKSTDKFF